ncbi:MAG: hypothetical protein COB67_00305 [SAR324 cluster bacterium]|uniref:Thioredoxin-like fold domain-containing protein n=1 Tax=SAR324 cluster bacterium TaxID=2024889 RepID=A0A2A4TC50_9DELT|nr:MAG: hypothetical protein COB67_00305 [SAR324 cluster bacterium]
MKFFFIFIFSAILAFSSEEAKLVPLEKFNKLKIFTDPNFELVSAIEFNKGYLLRGIGHDKNGFKMAEMFVPQDLKSITIGKTLNSNGKKGYTAPVTKEGEKIINNFKEKYLITNLESLKRNAAFVYGTGKEEYFLVTDPDCPYCKRFDKMIEPIADKIKLYVYLENLNIQGHEKASVQRILSYPRNDRGTELSKHFNQGKIKVLKGFSSSNKIVEEFESSKKNTAIFMKQFNVRGTPSLIDVYGSPKDLNSLIQAHKKTSSISPQVLKQLRDMNMGVGFGKNITKYIFAKAYGSHLTFFSSSYFNDLKKQGVYVILQADKGNEFQIKNALYFVSSKNKQTALKKVTEGLVNNKDISIKEIINNNQSAAASYMMSIYKYQFMKKNETVLIFDKNGNSLDIGNIL